MGTRKLKFESGVINPLLRCIKNNQEYLTKPENLPQLAKLGYMYNTLWYSGRVCFGYDGIISKGYQCEENPKYKIEMCDPIDDDIENLIYDAWGMHVSNDEMSASWEDFQKIVYQTEREYSDHEKLGLVVNKTMEQWVEYLTSDDYPYSMLYSGRREVVDNLLCTIGTGYDYSNGHIIMTASGADQNISVYGEWEKAKFAPKIQKVVDRVMAWEGLAEVLDKHEEIIDGYRKEKEAKDIKSFGMPYKEWCKLDKVKELMSDFVPTKEYQEYYPICNYSNITKFDENTHPSYIKAGIEICEEILQHIKEENEENVKFARTFLAKFKKKTFDEFKKELVVMIHKSENSFRKLRSKEPIAIEEIQDGLEEVDQQTLHAYFRSGESVYSTMVGMGLSNGK